MYKHLFVLLTLAPLAVFSQSDVAVAINPAIKLDTQRYVGINSTIITKPSSGKYKFRLKEHIAAAALMFMAGASDGFNQVVSYKYFAFKKAFPKVNDVFWSPQVSFRNKYKHHDPAQGEKFFGSTSFLVWTTDAYHASRFAEHLFMAGTVAVKISQQKKKWYYYIAEAAGYWIVNRAGFAVVYNSF
jgi:hypothetical protein